MIQWLFAFIISVVLFLLLVDWKQLNINIYGGIIAAIYKTIDSYVGYYSGLWIHNGANEILKSFIPLLSFLNIFFVGVTFAMGIIFYQLIPRNLSLQFIHSFIWTLFYTLFYFLAKEYNLITFVHFRFYLVSHVFIFFLSLSWFKVFYLKKENVAI